MAHDYRLLSLRDEHGTPAAGVLVGDRVHRAADLVGDAGIDATTVLGILERWDDAQREIARAVASIAPGDGQSLAAVQLCAPILYPRGIFSVWGNYVDHNAEMAALGGREAPVADPAAEPFFVQKTSAHSVIGPGAPVRMPAFTQQLDYEAELGVVIGHRVRNAGLAEAGRAVAGYVILNDLSARDMMKRTDPRTAHLMDWFGVKSFEDSAPMGPWLTPAAFVSDPTNLRLRLWVNGTIKQDGTTASMVYSIAAQVAALSRHLTLLPGDVIATGCPAGVGAARNEFLRVGDTVRIEIDGCGILENTIVPATSSRSVV